MMKAKINDENIDPYLKYKFIPELREYMKKADDDYLLLAIGDTGTGKSSLFLHFLDQFLGDKSDIHLIGLDKQQIADAMMEVSNREHPRGWICDEANFNKRDSMSKFNKDLMDMYLSIRGLNILHLWCNPTIDMIDKFFVQEKIKGVFLCTSKVDGRRPYFYFEKAELLQILEKYKNLKIDTITKVRKKYAKVMGWYRKYEGPLNKRYLEMKNMRMQEKVKSFQEKWGTSAWLTSDYAAEVVGVARSTIKRYLKDLKEEGKMVEEVDFKRSGNAYFFAEKGIEKLKEMKERMKQKSRDKIKNNPIFLKNIGNKTENLIPIRSSPQRG